MELESAFKPMPLGGWDPLGLRPRFGTYRGAIRLLLGELEGWSGRLARYEDPRWDEVRRLVFICTGNICRSPYAEYRARALGLPASSFGLSASTGAPADAIARRCAARRGIDLEPHRAREDADFEILAGDLLLAMEPRQGPLVVARFAAAPCQITLLGLWSTPRRPHIHDPHRLSEAYFDRCYAVIDSAIAAIGERMRRAGAGAAER